ncbi:hypothetical protein Ocin01_17383, partial [Orchesella cincta]
LGEFVKAKEGQVDEEFWKRIVHYKGGSGSTQVSGWITVFAVFDKDGNWQESRPVDRLFDYFLNETEKHRHQAWMDTFSQWPRIDMPNIPSGIVEVDVKIDDNGSEQKAVLFAGILQPK